MPWYTDYYVLSDECKANASGACDGTDCDCSCHNIPLSECAGWTHEDYRKWHSDTGE